VLLVAEGVAREANGSAFPLCILGVSPQQRSHLHVPVLRQYLVMQTMLHRIAMSTRQVEV
jgi:hypothetical protein